MRNRAILFIAFLFISINVAGQAPATAGASDLKATLQAKLDAWHAAGKFPGATLGVVLPNGESFGLATGYSDREAKTPMRPTDRMLAGSTGKTFAAAMAMQMVKDGQLNLDDKIEKFFGKRAVVRSGLECEGYHRSPADEPHERARPIRVQERVHRFSDGKSV